MTHLFFLKQPECEESCIVNVHISPTDWRLHLTNISVLNMLHYMLYLVAVWLLQLHAFFTWHKY
jgi:hypothetical protein